MAVAGSIVTTTSMDGLLAKYSIAWTCSAGGAVTENAVPLKAGRIVQVVMTPASGGDQPSDDYDVTLLQASGEDDLLAAAGTDCSNTLTKVAKLPSATLQQAPIWIPSGDYWPTVAAAGAAKKGTIDIYMI